MATKLKANLAPTFFTLFTSAPNNAKQLSLPTHNNISIANIANVLEHAPGIVNWKDFDLRFLGCNTEVARLLGLRTTTKIIGKSDEDLIWGNDGYADIFAQED